MNSTLKIERPILKWGWKKDFNLWPDFKERN